jgi:orotidine-5'-phosphate decarboxylase
VTVLTSMDAPTLSSVGVDRPLLDQVVALARLAQGAGLDGVVASPQEIAAIRRACGNDFAIVTPGIRGASAGSNQDDQSRTMSPSDAVRAGATYLVVGRPIIAATHPRAAAEAIVNDLTTAGQVR